MSTEPRHRPRRRGRSLVGVTSAVVALAGCVTGERPTLEPTPVVDDTAADVVLQRLERANSTAFTATYEITPSSTGVTTEATVRQLDSRRRVTIGDVDYLTDAGTSRTCRLDGSECVEFIDEARVSDLNITHRFWGEALASRLTIDASRRVGFSEGSNETIAGRPAACADVPVLGGNVLYCALDAGVLARYFGADVSIELTSFTDDVVEGDLTADGIDAAET